MNEITLTENKRNDRLLHNTGGPRSRVRSEPVSSNFWTDGYMKPDTAPGYAYRIELPEEVEDVELWLLDIGTSLGWNGWEQIIPHLDLPTNNMIVLNMSGRLALKDSFQILRAGVILSRCNQQMYLPEGPMIFSRTRLTRLIELSEIKTSQFYELD